MFAEGFDAAIIGWFQRLNGPPVVAYSYERCVAVLVEREGMDLVEAEQFMESDVVTAWMGEQTPAFVREVNPNPVNRCDA